MAQRARLGLLTDKDATERPGLLRSRICHKSHEITTMLCLTHRKGFTYGERCYSASGSTVLLMLAQMSIIYTKHTCTRTQAQRENGPLCLHLGFFMLMGVWSELPVFSLVARQITGAHSLHPIILGPLLLLSEFNVHVGHRFSLRMTKGAFSNSPCIMLTSLRETSFCANSQINKF